MTDSLLRLGLGSSRIGDRFRNFKDDPRSDADSSEKKNILKRCQVFLIRSLYRSNKLGHVRRSLRSVQKILMSTKVGMAHRFSPEVFFKLYLKFPPKIR